PLPAQRESWERANERLPLPRRLAREAGRSESELALGLGLFQLVSHAQALARGVVHLPGGLLRVLQLGQAVLDLRELFLDLTFELLDLALGHRKRVLVEL